jgi:O-acetyl-ADP-ribose deacetylase
LSNLQMDLPRNKDYVVTLKIGDHGEIRLLRGDITQIPFDAIVNAANSELCGVCGAIHRAGGPQIADECRRIRSERGRLAAGKAVATTAGNLPAKYVIHAVGPVWQGGDQGEAEVLASCYRESVRIADELKLHSIAFPAISTGIFGYPLEKAAGVAIPTLVDSLRSAKQILFDKASLDAFAKAALAQRQPDSGAPYNVVIGTNSA